MALKLKYTDERGILHINMSPSSTPRVEPAAEHADGGGGAELKDPKFDTINNRFGSYDLFGAKYDDSGGSQSLFRSRYNSIEEELANTPYAFATDRSLRVRTDSPLLDITIRDNSPSKDIEDNRFFRRGVDGLFGPEIDFKTSDEDETPAFTVTQLIHAQDRYFDLSSRSPKNKTVELNSSNINNRGDSKETKGTSVGKKSSLVVRSEPSSARKERVVTIVDGERGEAFRVLPEALNKQSATAPVVPISKRSREKSFAILTETPLSSRPSSPHSLPVEITIRSGRVSPFRGRGFREETSRHSTPKTSAANSRASSPPRRRTSSLSRVDDMAAATMPPPAVIHTMSRPHSPRNFVKQNIEEVRELSELNRERHEVEAEQKRVEEEVALLKEMGLIDANAKTDFIKSVVCSRTNSRSNSPNKLKLRSRSTSPTTVTAPSAILHYENIAGNGKEFINGDDGIPKPAIRKSRVRSLSRSQPQSNDTSPKHSKIPKRQGSVSPARETKRDFISKRPLENNLRNQRFISNSTSSIHESARPGHMNGRRGISKSTQLLNITPAHIKGKPPIFPSRVGPPPTNRAINPKRLSPIVGTPNKSPADDKSRTPVKAFPIVRKPVKAQGNTPATSRFNSRQPIKSSSREPSPDKRRPVSKSTTNKTVNNTKPVSRTPSTKMSQKPTMPKIEPKKPMNRTNSMKSLVKIPSTKALNEKPALLKKKDSSQDLKTQSTSKINEVGTKGNGKKSPTLETGVTNTINKNSSPSLKEELKEIASKTNVSTTAEEVLKQDNETQYDKITDEKGELVILTKKNVVSMTTAAITSQPLEIVTTVTNQLPATLEKAREKAMLERNSSKDSLGVKDEITAANDNKPDERKVRAGKIFTDDNIKLKPLLPPYNDPQVERVKQKIDDILTTTPEVSSENIVANASKLKENAKNTFKNLANQKKNEIRDMKNETTNKFTNLKDQVAKQNELMAAEIRSEASKIVDSIITPVEEPKDLIQKAKDDVTMAIEPVVMVVSEKKNPPKGDVMEKTTETLVKGEPDVEVQSSSLSTPGMGKNKIAVHNMMADGSGSDKSTSNGVFPQSNRTTPKPPARAHRRDQSKESASHASKETTPQSDKDDEKKKPNICSRLMGKCKSKCCPCCIKPEVDEDAKEVQEMEAVEKGKGGMLSKWNCYKKKDKDMEMEIEKAAGKLKTPSIEFEDEAQRKRKIGDMLCGCCGRRRRVSDVSDMVPRHVGDLAVGNDASAEVVEQTGCCGKRRVERRDSILSDRPPNSCCDNRLTRWVRGSCRRAPPELSASRRPSMFSKNKSLSPTLPPEDTRTKLDPSLVEHTSVMRGAIPVLPPALAYFCLFCNILVPGLGTIFSGIFCLCFGIPRFGVHDGAKHRIGSFVINLLVGCGQLFCLLFCLVGWGWSIWWGTIMVKISRKYRRLKAEKDAEEAENAPPVTANNHTRA